jgi:hypothetical protein
MILFGSMIKFHVIEVTNFMEQGMYWESNSCSSKQEIPLILGNCKVYSRVNYDQPAKWI